MGERSPINDTNARGTFIGLSMDTTRADLVQAVLEGVAFAVRDCFEVAKALNIPITSSRLCGGGARSVSWAGSQALSTCSMPNTMPTASMAASQGSTA